MTDILIDAELKQALDTLPAEPPARMGWMAQGLNGGLSADVSVSLEERAIPGPDGADLNLRIFTPPAPGPLPVVLYCHGGAFLANVVPINDVVCRDLAVAGECIVVAADFRLSPQHVHPAAFDDCYQTLTWIVANADAIGADPSRLAVSGGSSGGALAAAVTIAARDRSGPNIALLHLSNPMLDDRLTTPSATNFTDTPMMNRGGAAAAWARYLGEGVEGDAYGAPARAQDLAGMPATYVEVAQWDPLRDEGIDFATRLLAAGVEVELHLFAGTFHGSEMHLSAGVSRYAAELRGDALRRALARPTKS